MRRLLVALALVGCSGPVRTVAIDYTATDAQAAALDRRISEWNAILTEGHRLRHADSPDVDVFVVLGDPRNGRAAGWRSSTGRITIWPDLGDDHFERALGHELGHAIGLEHTECGVMNGRDGVIASAEFCGDDIRECRAVGACP